MLLKSCLKSRRDDDRDHVLTVAIDLDGTIAEYHHGYDLEETAPRPGARAALERLWDEGYRIVIWTARDDDADVEDWLDEYRIPYDFFNYNPDQPTHSRKITADLYLDDRGLDARGSWDEVLAQTLARLREARPDEGHTLRRQHLILTGPSGVGKTTTSNLLARATGRPIWKLDADTEWLRSDAIADHPERFEPGTKAFRQYRKLLKKLVRRALRRKTPSILEGCQFLVAPGTLRGHQVVVLDADEETIVRQRLQRDADDGKLTPFNRAEREAKARFLYHHLRPAIDFLKSLPGVETVTPAKAIEWVHGFERRRSSKAYKNDFAGITPDHQLGAAPARQGGLVSRLADRSGEGLGARLVVRPSNRLRVDNWAEGWHTAKESFFSECDRDEQGHCKPGSGKPASKLPRPPKKPKPTLAPKPKPKPAATAPTQPKPQVPAPAPTAPTPTRAAAPGTRISGAALRRLQQQAQAKFQRSTRPTAAEIADANRRMDAEGADRYESNIRGNTASRASSRKRLLQEFGNGQTCPCIYCGLTLDDSSVTRDKMYVARQGGRYRQDNLVPACLACNKARSDTPFEDVQWHA